MSTRTIIEINHDHLGELRRDIYPLARLLAVLAACDTANEAERQLLRGWGIRILGQRHHSEPDWVQGGP